MLLALAAIWGSSFMFIKVAVREVAPAEVVFGRVLVGTVALAVLLTAFLYAASSVFAGARLREAPALVTSLGSLAFATLATLPLGLAQLPGDPPGWKAIAAIVALGAAGLSVAYLLYFTLIAGSGAPYAALVTYLVPACGLFCGSAFLSQPI